MYCKIKISVQNMDSSWYGYLCQLVEELARQTYCTETPHVMNVYVSDEDLHHYGLYTIAQKNGTKHTPFLKFPLFHHAGQTWYHFRHDSEFVRSHLRRLEGSVHER